MMWTLTLPEPEGAAAPEVPEGAFLTGLAPLEFAFWPLCMFWPDCGPEPYWATTVLVRASKERNEVVKCILTRYSIKMRPAQVL